MFKLNTEFGGFGGCYAPETLIGPLRELEKAFIEALECEAFNIELRSLLRDFVGRPTPLYYAQRLSEHLGGAKIYFKREDLAHTGAHKINNTLGQVLLAKKMGKTHIFAETGAGQHGVATATAASLLGLQCTVYMGEKDMARQALNVTRMQLLGATVKAVHTGSKTLKDATSQAMRDWVVHLENTYYVIGSVVGPHPYPTIVKHFQSVIGDEAKIQVQDLCNRLPDHLIACVGGGSNAIGLFSTFLSDACVSMTGVEAGGQGVATQRHAAKFFGGKPGVLQGMKTYMLQDGDGQILPTHSISAGLDYPGVGPQHCFLYESNRANYTHVHDEQALDAALLLSKLEGIIPALESAHAIAYAIQLAAKLSKDKIILIGLSGRGDKDIELLKQRLESNYD